MLAASRLVLFPGMGADGRMYDGLRKHIGPLIVPPWLAPIPGEDLNHYAQRYVVAGHVRDGDVVGGSSFGGMVAQAVVAHINVSAVILMGSCRSVTALPALALALSPMARLVPTQAFASPAAAWALSLKFGISRIDHRRLFVAMSNTIDPRHVRWVAQPLEPGEPTAPFLARSIRSTVNATGSSPQLALEPASSYTERVMFRR